MEKGVDPEQLVSQKKPADLDLPCLKERIEVSGESAGQGITINY